MAIGVGRALVYVLNRWRWLKTDDAEPYLVVQSEGMGSAYT